MPRQYDNEKDIPYKGEWNVDYHQRYGVPGLKMLQPEQIKDAIYQSQGVYSTICRRLDCSYFDLTYYIKHSDDAQNWLKEARAQIVDFAEEVLMKSLSSDDEKLRLDAAKYTLKTLGKDRGWNESNNVIGVQINTTDGDKIKQVNAIFGLDTPDESKE